MASTTSNPNQNYYSNDGRSSTFGRNLMAFIQNKLPAIDGVTVKGYAFIPNIIKSLHQWTPREEEFSENKNFKYVKS